MAIKRLGKMTSSQRHGSKITKSGISKKKPEKRLVVALRKRGGRDNQGHVAVRSRGGGHKRFVRVIDFKRDKKEIEAKVEAVEYDPGRTANIALLLYKDGERRYILAPSGLKEGDKVLASEKAEVKPGNFIPLAKIPAGTVIHNIEMSCGKGGQLVRSAGSGADLMSKEGKYAQVRMPSGEVRLVLSNCWATVGVVGNQDWKNVSLGKAGRKRWMGRRPKVRGVAQHPGSHPHGGGEGRSGIGMPSPKSPWGKKTLGKKTRRRTKYSDRMIIQKRK